MFFSKRLVLLRLIEEQVYGGFLHLDKRIDTIMADLSKLQAADAHIIKNFEALRAAIADLVDRLNNLHSEDPALQGQIDAIAFDLETEAAKTDPPVVPPPVEPTP